MSTADHEPGPDPLDVLPGVEAPPSRRRRSAPEIAAGVAVTLLLHGGIVAAVLYQQRAHANDVLIIPRDPMMATLARLGKKRDLSWLPHKQPPPRAHRRRAPSITYDENARPTPIDHRKNEQVTTAPKAAPDQAAQSAADLARQLAATENADDPNVPANVPRYGNPNGSAFGNAETGSDLIASAVHWSRPLTVSDADCTRSLQADVRLKVADHELVDFALVRPSGNDLFDQTVELTLQRAEQDKDPIPDLGKDEARAEAGELEIGFPCK